MEVEDALPPASGASAATGAVTIEIWRALKASSLASVIRMEAREGGAAGKFFCPHFVHMQACPHGPALES